MHAYELAQKSNLDNPAIDALHMMTFVDTAPDEQLVWNRKAITLMQASVQQDAKKWEGSLYNNTGYALYQLGRYQDALLAFELALAAHERGGNPQAIRIAYWMIAWTLHAQGQLEKALEIQLRLEQECDQAGEPDPYVFKEPELISQARQDNEQAEFYAARQKAIIQSQ